MSDSAVPAEECPACGSEQMSYWEGLQTWICDECSYVIDESPAEMSSPIHSDEVEDEDSTDKTWKQSISITDTSEANLVELLTQVEDLADTLSLSTELTTRAAEISVEAWETNFMHGRSQPDTVGAAVYAASRELQRAVPPATIATAVASDCQSIKDTYRKLKSELQLEIAPPQGMEYVGHICRELNLSDDIAATAETLLENHSASGNPVGIAAAAVYVAAHLEGNEVTLREAADITGLTKETIWRQADDLRESINSD